LGVLDCNEQEQEAWLPQRQSAYNIALLYGANGVSNFQYVEPFTLGMDHECDRQTDRQVAVSHSAP